MRKRPDLKVHHHRTLFTKWLTGNRSLSEIADNHGVNRRTLARWFTPLWGRIQQPPVPHAQSIFSIDTSGSNPWAEYSTPEGIQLGTRQQDMVSVMGPPERTVTGGGFTSFYYDRRGIRFTLYDTGPLAGKVGSMRVVWPSIPQGDTACIQGGMANIVRALTKGGAHVTVMPPPDRQAYPHGLHPYGRHCMPAGANTLMVGASGGVSLQLRQCVDYRLATGWPAV